MMKSFRSGVFLSVRKIMIGWDSARGANPGFLQRIYLLIN